MAAAESSVSFAVGQSCARSKWRGIDEEGGGRRWQRRRREGRWVKVQRANGSEGKNVVRRFAPENYGYDDVWGMHFFLPGPMAGCYYKFWGFIRDMLDESINLAPEHTGALYFKQSNIVLLKLNFLKKCLNVGIDL
jgi:hypothetical protein